MRGDGTDPYEQANESIVAAVYFVLGFIFGALAGHFIGK